MKKLLAIMLSLMMVVSFAACTSSTDDAGEPDGEPEITEPVDDDQDAPVDDDQDAPVDDGNTISGAGYQVTIPDGFELGQEMDGATVILPTNYPERADNITIMSTDKDPTFGNLDQEMLEQVFAAMLGGMDINFVSFDNTTVDGCAAYKAVCTVEMSGINMTMTLFMIDGNSNTVVFNFTQAGDEDMTALIDTFIASAKML